MQVLSRPLLVQPTALDNCMQRHSNARTLVREPMLLGEEPWTYSKYMKGNKYIVITYITLTRYKELKYISRFVKVYCATLKMTRYIQWRYFTSTPSTRSICILSVTFV